MLQLYPRTKGVLGYDCCFFYRPGILSVAHSSLLKFQEHFSLVSSTLVNQLQDHIFQFSNNEMSVVDEFLTCSVITYGSVGGTAFSYVIFVVRYVYSYSPPRRKR